jgi:hypothetical protein
LNRPLVADYVPAGKPPWALLVVITVLLLLSLPTPYFGLAAALSGLGVAAYLIGRPRESTTEDRASDGLTNVE